MTRERRDCGQKAAVGVIACLAALLAGCAEGERAGPAPTVRVERVIDGDTVELTRFGKTRLIGVDAPEEGRCGDNAATRFTRRELEGETVKYELGKDREDRYRRTLAYLRVATECTTSPSSKGATRGP